MIIPTLNEEENIGMLINLIVKHMSSNDFEIIVVDDSSSDNTQGIVNQIRKANPSVRLIVRGYARGLGGAVRLAGSQAKDGPVIVMDADLSHHPKYLPQMFDLLAKGYDVVIGSRYARTGKVIGWPGSRIAISRIATNMARLVFRLPISDPMSGFVGFSSPDLLVHGFILGDFKFLLEILVRNWPLRVKEIPITFHERTRGRSKLGSSTIFHYLGLILSLIIKGAR
ncbi:MAG: polyprenol monophosphomannose synthase [Candidatus Thorarchaeota archaeon]